MWLVFILTVSEYYDLNFVYLRLNTSNKQIVFVNVITVVLLFSTDTCARSTHTVLKIFMCCILVQKDGNQNRSFFFFFSVLNFTKILLTSMISYLTSMTSFDDIFEWIIRENFMKLDFSFDKLSQI